MAKKALKTGDTVTIRNRLYGVVDANGKLCEFWVSRTLAVPAIYLTRKEAREDCGDLDRVIRLSDLSGTVI